MWFRDNVADPLWLSTHLTNCLYHVSFRRYRLLKLPLSCEVVQKGGFWAPGLHGDGIPQISDMCFQITLTSDHVAEYNLVPFSELRAGGEKRRMKERIPVKYKSADILCRAA